MNVSSAMISHIYFFLVATPRILEMAQAKTTAQAPDADFKENAFQVSPNALKYKPSKRILEMAQPRGS